nr:hypothetical protein Iba_chr14bCG13680 [Ipomoea batatas]
MLGELGRSSRRSLKMLTSSTQICSLQRRKATVVVEDLGFFCILNLGEWFVSVGINSFLPQLFLDGRIPQVLDFVVSSSRAREEEDSLFGEARIEIEDDDVIIIG